MRDVAAVFKLIQIPEEEKMNFSKLRSKVMAGAFAVAMVATKARI